MRNMNKAWIDILPAFIRTKLEDRADLQKIINNIVWLFLDKLLRMGVGLFVGVWIARYLGPEQFGLLSYATAFVVIFSSIATLGLDSIVVRTIVREPERKNEILGTVFTLKLIGGAVAFALTMLSIFFLRPADYLSQWLIGVITLGTIFQAFDTIDLWFQSLIQCKYTVIAKNAAFILVSCAKVSLILLKAPIIAFAWAGTVEVVIGAAGLVFAYKVSGGSIMTWERSRELGLRLFHDSWPLMFSTIVGVIYLRIDQVMLGQMVSNSEVGIYSASVQLAEVWYFIPMAIYTSVYPSILKAKSISEELFYERLQYLYNLMAFLAYAIAIPVTFISGWAVNLLFGPAYSRAGELLALLIWAGIFINLGVARSTFLMSMNWTRVHLFTSVLGCLTNVGLNLLLIPRYGAMGAVIASCVAYWFTTHGACYLYKPLFKTGNMLTKAVIYPKIW